MTKASQVRFFDNTFWMLTGIVVLCAAYRFLPYVLDEGSALYTFAWGCTPMFAMLLFSGAYFRSRWAALLVPLSAMMCTDLVLHATGLAPVGWRGRMVVYATLAWCIVVGFWVGRRLSARRIGAGVAANAGVFFLVTNFRAWLASPAVALPPDLQRLSLAELVLAVFSNPYRFDVTGYPKTLDGLLQCYVMALPFLRNQLIGDAVFAAVLFGGYALVQRWVSAWCPPQMQPAMAGDDRQ